METAKIVIAVLQGISSIAIMLLVLLQEGKSAGLSGPIAGGAETFFGKNKSKTREARLSRFTTIGVILFAGLTIALTVVSTMV